MEQETIDLVQESWVRVICTVPQAGDMFYQRLFDSAPYLRPLFKSDTSDQGRALMQMIGVAVSKLNDLPSLIPILEGLGRRHASYGVKNAHYAKVGAALIDTLSDGLGGDFTPQVRNAWLEVYGVISNVMQSATMTREVVIDPR